MLTYSVESFSENINLLELEKPLILSVVLGDLEPPKSSKSVCSPGNFQHKWRFLSSRRVRLMEVSLIWLHDRKVVTEPSPPQRRSPQLE